MNIKNEIIRGAQNTEAWHKLRLGLFTSSEIYRLFVEPSKQSKARAAMKQIKNGLWAPKTDLFDGIPPVKDITYAGTNLKDFGLISDYDLKLAKKGIADARKNTLIMNDLLCSGGLDDSNEMLLIRACFAIENVHIVSDGAFTYAEEKANELIYEKRKENTASESKAVEWGNEWEPVASENFEDLRLKFLLKDEDKVSFIRVDGLETGGSPDDVIIGELAPVEYKCPINTTIHMRHCKIMNQDDLFAYDKQKYYQIMHQMWLLGSKVGYWNSFDPRCFDLEKNEHKALHTVIIEADSKVFSQFEPRIRKATEVRDQEVATFYR